MAWVPHITVASIIKQDDKYLFVEEYVQNNLVINQPAGHLEENESIIEACIRETLEETAYLIVVNSLVGVYQERKKNSLDMWLRFCFDCTIKKEFKNRKLDKNIVKKLWLSKDEIINKNISLRSSMVLKCIEDYENNKKYPLEILSSLLEK